MEAPVKLGTARVRSADFDDITGILDTLLEASKDKPHYYPMPELPYAMQYTLDLIAQGLVYVAETPAGQIVGVIALDWAHWPGNRQVRYLYNQHLWVDHLWRKNGTAIRLLSKAREMARMHNVPVMLETSYSAADSGKISKFLERSGFLPIGGKFLLHSTD